MDTLYSEVNNFDKIMTDIMAYLPSDVDTREGSVIYNAVAGVAGRLTELYTDMDRFQNELDPTTATRDGLERACAMRGITPYAATQATVEGRFSPVGLPLTGERFSLDGLIYEVQELTASDAETNFDTYQLLCETAGEAGNIMGTLIPVETVTGLTSAAITDVLIPGEDEESDSSLRQRYLASFEAYGFGGNMADYKDKVNALSGVGACKVYPAWNGGGTVKVVIIGPDYASPDSTVVDYVQEQVDPIGSQGTGTGIAPIGHTVTVEAAPVNIINVAATLTLETDYVLADVVDAIKTVLGDYYTSLNSEWSEKTVVVRIAQLEARILGVAGVEDVTATTINGVAENYTVSDGGVVMGGTFNGV